MTDAERYGYSDCAEYQEGECKGCGEQVCPMK